ncbi:MAG: hypothetical protein EP330_30755 [Deltaproteobacteria bacterium]|nr:MAG: hypothetical protein EP330_30755 [Deltaproteobacteria bacterium]
MTSIRSLPDRTHRAYLMPISGFALAMMVLWAVSLTPVALSLLYLLSVYNIGLTLWWSRDMYRRRREGEIEEDEVTAGLIAVIRLLGWSSVLPVVLFAATDPLSTEVWKTAASIGILTTIALTAGPWLARRGHRATSTAGLVVALAALPLNTSGALSMAFWLGWVEALTGIPTGAA